MTLWGWYAVKQNKNKKNRFIGMANCLKFSLILYLKPESKMKYDVTIVLKFEINL